jgi:hypothetical protein
VEIRSLLDVDHGLGHGAAKRVIQDGNLRAGQLYSAADNQQHDEEKQEHFHGAIMPYGCKAAAGSSSLSAGWSATVLTGMFLAPGL